MHCAGRSVLDLCCAQGNIELAEKILDAGVDIETRAGTGRTPLYSASRHGRPRLVQLLLERGARVHVMNRYGWMPVNVAADGGHAEVVKFLVEKGADVTVADNNGPGRESTIGFEAAVTRHESSSRGDQICDGNGETGPG